MILKSLLIATLLILTLSSDIIIGCGSTNCPAGCFQCTTISGGPFPNIITCVDNSGGCKSTGSSTFSVGCSVSCGSDCSYTISEGSQSGSGCMNDNDQAWPTLKLTFDLVYALYVNPNNTYNWCT